MTPVRAAVDGMCELCGARYHAGDLIAAHRRAGRYRHTVCPLVPHAGTDATTDEVAPPEFVHAYVAELLGRLDRRRDNPVAHPLDVDVDARYL